MQPTTRYSETRSHIAGATLWASSHAQDVTTSILPDGCMDVIWSDGALIVSGPDLDRRQVTSAGEGHTIGLRLPPGLAPILFRVSAADLTGRVVDLAALAGDGRARRLADALAAEGAAGADSRSSEPGAALERFVVDSLPTDLDDLFRSDPLLSVPRFLRSGMPVADVASAVGYSARQLQRKSLTAFGYGPKTLDAILRFQQATSLLAVGTPLAATAAMAGYADQSHLSRAFTRFAGVGPSRWMTRAA
ncbi:helix-turn-helix domain-containing protein [Plantibacter sp. Mn2098]|uniref:helix-turn-helix domain-containing protein n=1 Tax=Plantibacter sp. Mn2098 TaxID=3395266 RepID=UPI003BCFF3CC